MTTTFLCADLDVPSDWPFTKKGTDDKHRVGELISFSDHENITLCDMCGHVHAAGGLTSREMCGLHPGQRCHTWGFEAQRSRGFLSILPIQVLGSNASTRSTSTRWAAGVPLAAPLERRGFCSEISSMVVLHITFGLLFLTLGVKEPHPVFRQKLRREFRT